MENEIHKKKRNRGDNWTVEDKTLLQDLVRERVGVIENKNTDTNTNRLKQKAWTELLGSFNEISATKRTLLQLKSQWSIAKMNAKKAKTIERREILKTGGGPQNATQTVSSEDISSWLPNEFVIDFNSFDSDNNQQVVVLDESISMEKNTQPEVGEKSQSAEDKEGVLPEVVADDKNVDHDKLFNKRSRKRKQKPSDFNAAKAIMECNLKCTQELHAMKMKTEEMKQRNLDLEHTILQEKLKFDTNK